MYPWYHAYILLSIARVRPTPYLQRSSLDAMYEGYFVWATVRYDIIVIVTPFSTFPPVEATVDLKVYRLRRTWSIVLTSSHHMHKPPGLSDAVASDV